jgi:hypothetical protein
LSAPSVPQLISYQGRLTDTAGNPLTGDYDMHICLYAEPAGGSALWCEQATVSVSYGVFSRLLGSVNSIPDALFDGSNLYLGVKVGADDEMTPRRRVVSVGYAYRAESAVDADTVDSMHASDLASASDFAAHESNENAHHTKTTDASEITSGTMAPERILGTAWTSTNDGTGSTLDADMVDGIHASTSPEANKLVPLDANGKLPASVVPFRIYDSGWFAVTQSGTYAKTHNLGTNKLLATIWFSESSNGSNAILADEYGHGTTDTGLQIRDLTTTTYTLQAHEDGVAIRVQTNGAEVPVNSGYARVLLIALD